MKKTLTLLTVAAISMASIVGCKKSDSSPSYSMHATIGSTPYNVSNCYGIMTGTYLNIEGVVSLSTFTYPYVDLVITNYTGKGTYTIDGANNLAAVQTDANTATAATTGTITITGEKPYTGTFSFTETDGTVVSNGTFTAQSN